MVGGFLTTGENSSTFLYVIYDIKNRNSPRTEPELWLRTRYFLEAQMLALG
jgi:hypothetical protein